MLHELPKDSHRDMHKINTKVVVPFCKSAVTRQLPANARAYLSRVGELVGQPVDIVSVGPERDQTIIVNKR